MTEPNADPVGVNDLDKKIAALVRGDLPSEEHGQVVQEVSALVAGLRERTAGAIADIDKLERGEYDISLPKDVDPDVAVERLKGAIEALESASKELDPLERVKLLVEVERWSVVCADHVKANVEIVERELDALTTATGATGK